MAAVSLSPIPAPLPAMSTSRRVPLSNNPNVANSPLRGGPASAALGAFPKRSYASSQREDIYSHQPPPAKKQMLNNAAPRAIRSPVKSRPASYQPGTSRTTAATHAREKERERASQQQQQPSRPPQGRDEDHEAILRWVASQKAQFPRHVFYFESVPDEIRAKLARQLHTLGAREEKFFSISITHVITTRAIPRAPPASQHASAEPTHEERQRPTKQPETINPSLLSRTNSETTSTKRKLFEIAPASRRPPIRQLVEETVRRPKGGRSLDILDRALEMNKKIWTLEKMQKIVNTILEQDPQRRYELVSGARVSHAPRAAEEGNLLQLLNKERANGPSDRDAAASLRELHHFKGPFFYVYDVEEKLRPIMVREYPKTVDKTLGDWPQFRSVSKGRCPFLEDEQEENARKAEARAAAAAAAAANAVESAPKLEPPAHISRPRPVTGKRSLAQMDEAEANSRQHNVFTAPSKIIAPPTIDFNPTAAHAFISNNRARPGRFLAGEPVASGLQPSGVTSAIRSQMVSSTTGVLGAKTGVSKEVMGLQRKVLQKSGSTAHHDLSSRRQGEMSVDSGSFIRSASASAGIGAATAATQRFEAALKRNDVEGHKRTNSVPSRLQPKPKRRDPKPGYCENCQDKFDDFEDHIVSRTHRKFAENNENWTDLDKLLRKLIRASKSPKYQDYDDVEDEDED